MKRCLGAAEFYRRLRESRPRTGASLLESTEPTARGGRISLVAVEPLVRLVLGGGELRAVSLNDRGPALTGLLPLRPLPKELDDQLTDEQRLLAPSVFDEVRSLVGLVEDEAPTNSADFPICVLGAFGFDLIESPRTTTTGYDLMLAIDGVVFDHLEGTVRVTCRSLPTESDSEAEQRVRDLCALLAEPVRQVPILVTPARLPDLGQPAAFLRGIENVLAHIRSGDVFQAVLSHQLVIESEAKPFDVYSHLVQANPSPHHFFIELESGELLGASPEPAVTVRGQRVELTPIAGTRPRGRDAAGNIDAERDRLLANELVDDPKEQAEHAMLVDLARNDLARISQTGTRRVLGAPQVERFSHVQHLVSRVRGELREGFDALTAYAACANMGTLTGAPKSRATALIGELEPVARGFYGGAVGVLTAAGDLTTAITIRALHHANGRYCLQAGAGIVAASDPQRELEEVRSKLGAPYSALVAAIGSDVTR